MEDRWLSVEEIGKYLDVSSDTIYRWKEQVEAGGAADKSRQDQAE